MQRMSEQALSIGANSTSTNRMIGTLGEFLKRVTALRIAAVAAAAGLVMQFIIGESLLVNNQAVSSANRYPNLKDDVVIQTVANKDRRILLFFTNTTGGAVTVNWFVDVLS